MRGGIRTIIPVGCRCIVREIITRRASRTRRRGPVGGQERANAGDRTVQSDAGEQGTEEAYHRTVRLSTVDWTQTRRPFITLYADKQLIIGYYRGGPDWGRLGAPKCPFTVIFRATTNTAVSICLYTAGQAHRVTDVRRGTTNGRQLHLAYYCKKNNSIVFFFFLSLTYRTTVATDWR